MRGVEIIRPIGAIMSINSRGSGALSLNIDHIREVDVMHVENNMNGDNSNNMNVNNMNVNNGGSGDDNNGGSGGESSPVVEEDIVFSPLRPTPRSPILNHARYGKLN